MESRYTAVVWQGVQVTPLFKGIDKESQVFSFPGYPEFNPQFVQVALGIQSVGRTAQHYRGAGVGADPVNDFAIALDLVPARGTGVIDVPEAQADHVRVEFPDQGAE
jgi:hypothetical protein